MINQVALRLHTRPGDEVILDQSYHFNVCKSARVQTLSLKPVTTEDAFLPRARDLPETFPGPALA